MGKPFTQCNETEKLKRILCKRPQEAFQTQFLIDTNWKAAGWSQAPEFNTATQEHFRFMRFLQAQGVTVNYHDDEWIISLDSVFIRDTCVMTPAGVIVGCLHAAHRIAEPESVASYIEQLGGTKVGAIEAPGMLSGSDVVWVSKDLVVVAESPLTNRIAIDQLRKIFDDNDLLKNVKVLVVKLAQESPDAPVRSCLKNALSPLKDNVILIASHKFSSEDLESLKNAGLTLETVTEDEYKVLGASVLVVNKFAACIPADTSLKRVKEAILETKYGYTVYPIEYAHLGRGGMGLGSTIVTLHRADS